MANVGAFGRGGRLGRVIAAVLAGVVVVTTAGLISRTRARADLVRMDPERIASSPDLRPVALRAGRAIFRAHCAVCHGEDGRGNRAGNPDLRDRDFLYGSGRVEEIETIIRYGIRSGDPRGFNLASMPAYATARPYKSEPIPPLSPAGMEDVIQYVLSFSHHATDGPASRRGRLLFTGQAGCWDCHEPDGGGDPSIGAPNLTDGIWLYGNGSAAAIRRSLEHGLAGSSPAFRDRLTAFETRAAAVYVTSLIATDGAAADGRRPVPQGRQAER